MAKNSSLLESVCSLSPTWITLRDFGGSFLVDVHISDLSGRYVRYAGYLREAPGHCGQKSHRRGQVSLPVHPAATVRNTQPRPCVKPSSSSLAACRSTSQSAGSPSMTQMDLRHTVAQRRIVHNARGVKHIRSQTIVPLDERRVLHSLGLHRVLIQLAKPYSVISPTF